MKYTSLKAVIRLAAGIAIGISWIFPQPLAAQDRPFERELERQHLDERDAAREWARKNNVPLRVEQDHGGHAELVAVVGGRPLYVTTANTVAAATTRTNRVYPGGESGLNLTGSDMQIGIWDDGRVFANHVEFGGRVSFGDDGAGPTFHATHVAGTLAASGVDPNARGMAFQASLTSYDWTNDTSEINNAARDGLLLSNHSYGFIRGWFFGNLEEQGNRWYWFGDPRISTETDYQYGRYITISAQWDNVALQNPYFLPVVAAGNDRNQTGPTQGQMFRGFDDEGNWRWYSTVTDFHPPPNGFPGGFDTIADRGIAKNTLTVGSVHDRPQGSGAILVSGFSSFGPSDDGRVKPDLVGNGESLYSTSNASSSAYAWARGTSMAAPNVTGSLALLQQYYLSQTSEYMRAATLKGLAIHTAEDAGNPGPDYQTGWGLLNTQGAATLVTNLPANRLHIQEHALANGGVFEQTAIVQAPGNLRVTLSWTDPPATVLPVTGPESLRDRRPRLINDLDLRIINQTTGAEYLPWVLDPDNPGEPAARGDNVVDNVEQVLVADVEPGDYLIRVTHKGQLQQVAEQPFSLIVTGAFDRIRQLALTNLSASANVDAVRLEWRTLFERTEGDLLIERIRLRQDLDGQVRESEPEVVGVIALEGDSEATINYEFVDPFVPAGTYIYRLSPDLPDEEPFVELSIVVNVPAPRQYQLISNYPNPFTESTRVRLDLPATMDVTVEIYDLLGRRIAVVVDRELPAARHDFSVDTSDWSSGVYFLRITSGEGAIVRKMMKAH